MVSNVCPAIINLSKASVNIVNCRGVRLTNQSRYFIIHSTLSISESSDELRNSIDDVAIEFAIELTVTDICCECV